MPSGRKRVIDCYVADHRLEKRRRRCPQPNSIEILIYYIRNFEKKVAEERDSDGDWLIELPTLEAHGYKWNVTVYPNPNNKTKMNFALYIEDEGVVVKFEPTFRMHSASDEPIKEQEYRAAKIAESDPIEIGYDLTLINNFTLLLDIKFLGLEKHVWFPKKDPREKTLAKLFECKETSDVTFVVGGHNFDVHKCILFCKCKKLYEIANESGRDAHAIPIQSIKKGAFENMIEYIYNQTIHSVSLEEAKELLIAADRFECIDLKLYMESVITFYDLKCENAAELLIFANSYSCALLWEAAVKEYLRGTKTVKKSGAWKQVSKELLEELLEDVVSITKRGAEKNDNDDKAIEMMDVADLRNELQEAALPLDGSRSVLVKRLETHRKEGSGGAEGNNNDDEQDDIANS